jgi:hypothetical protein
MKKEGEILMDQEVIEAIRLAVKQSVEEEDECGMDASKVYGVLGSLQSTLLELVDKYEKLNSSSL